MSGNKRTVEKYLDGFSKSDQDQREVRLKAGHYVHYTGYEGTGTGVGTTCGRATPAAA
jgi:hypothetical protein